MPRSSTGSWASRKTGPILRASRLRNQGAAGDRQSCRCHARHGARQSINGNEVSTLHPRQNWPETKFGTIGKKDKLFLHVVFFGELSSVVRLPTLAFRAFVTGNPMVVDWSGKFGAHKAHQAQTHCEARFHIAMRSSKPGR